MSEERKLRENGYLRLALMFGDNNASTFRKNLEKMIRLLSASELFALDLTQQMLKSNNGVRKHNSNLFFCSLS